MYDFTIGIEDYLTQLKEALNSLDVHDVNTVLNVIKSAYEGEKTIFIMGNGGSAATASHIVCDINKGVSFGKNKRFKMMCLNDNIPTILAYANDFSYDDVFVEQLKNFLRSGDIVIGISVSGNSANVLKAIEYANEKNAITVGLCGYNGGHLKKKVKYFIHVGVDDMQIAEDMHLIIGHIMMRMYEKVIA